MLITKYQIEVYTPPCEPGAERFAARARLDVDISPVFPFLNAVLKGAIYHRKANAITWKKGGHNIAFHPYEIATSNVENQSAAEKEIRGLIELVNRTWERRGEIEPSYKERKRPTPMDVYRHLPRSNCKECGEPTCWTFALKVIAGQHSLFDCPTLKELSGTPELAELQSLIGEFPRIG